MKRVFALSVVCALMVACDSETDSSTSYPDISDYDYIDLGSDNANANVSAALRGVGSSDSDVTLPSDDAAAVSALGLAQSFASDYFNASARQSKADTQSGSVSCEDGGTLSIEVQGDLTSSGDWIQAVFSNCLEDDTLSSGGLRIVVGASSIVSSDLSATYQSLSITDTASDVSATLNGDLRMGWQRTGTTLTSVMSSNSLNMVSSEDGDVVISDLDIVQVSDSSTQDSSLSIDYDIASDELGGHVAFDTVQSLVYEGGNKNPSTGILKLSGASGSSVTLDAFTGDLETVLMTINNGSSVSSDEVRWDSIADSDLAGLADF